MVKGTVRQTAAFPSLSKALARAGLHGVSGRFVLSMTNTELIVIKTSPGVAPRKIYLAQNTKVVQSHAYPIPDRGSYISTSELGAGEAPQGESLSLHFVSSPDTVGGLVELLSKTALIKNNLLQTSMDAGLQKVKLGAQRSALKSY
jgi:hypothetical protein